MADSKDLQPVRFAPFDSAIEIPFYYSLAQHKIDYDKLSDAPRRLLGQYVPRDGQRMQILGDALSSDEYVLEHRKPRIMTDGAVVWLKMRVARRG